MAKTRLDHYSITTEQLRAKRVDYDPLTRCVYLEAQPRPHRAVER